MKLIPWVEVYRRIAGSLNAIFLEYGRESGDVLCDLLFINKEYIDSNNWIKKFIELDGEIDPIHIFSSISDLRLKKENRIKRVNLLLEILEGPDVFDAVYSIDMEGCPLPYTMELTSFRNNEYIEQVWVEFNRVYELGAEGLLNDMFRGPEKWLGIGVPLFSQFLYWVRPDSFMPIDKYTLKFLNENNKLYGDIESLAEYKNILTAEDDKTYRLIYCLSHGVKTIGDLSPKDFIRFKKYFSITSDHYVKSENSSNKCRILALRTMEGCNPKFSKSIKEGQLYRFYNDFIEYEDKVIFNTDVDCGLYNTEDLNFNISAIAGRNGTGKSTLLELLVVGLNNLACSKASMFNAVEELIPVDNVFLEFYFETDTIYKVVIKDKDCCIQRYAALGNYEFIKSDLVDVNDFDFSNFFYTILINYSLHGLNSEHLGLWLKGLFHKNDGYQIPAVIEPYRLKGNININRQEFLAKQRLLSNLLELEDEDDYSSLRRLKGDVKAKYIRLTNTFEKDERDRLLTNSEFDIINALFIKFEVSNVECSVSYNYDDAVDVAKIYLIRKLHAIASRYSAYEDFIDSENKLVSSGYGLENFVGYLYEDTSHITYKVRQVLNFLKHSIYSDLLDKKIDIDKLSKKISYLMSLDKSNRIEYFLPPAYYNLEIFLGEQGEIDFSSLSSGEKQKIYVINSILYHVRNIDSVYKGGNDQISKYGYVNLFLDEIELYFHPELQRNFINDLLELLSRRPLLSVYGINICFVTHSPFILSDIPVNSVLFLDVDKSDEDSHKSLPVSNVGETFAANIHDLLASGFFMEGTIGRFSEECITEVVELYEDIKRGSDLDELKAKYLQNKDRYNFILESISDSEIKGILYNYIQYIEMNLNLNIDNSAEIMKLEKRLELLKSKG